MFQIAGGLNGREHTFFCEICLSNPANYWQMELSQISLKTRRKFLGEERMKRHSSGRNVAAAVRLHPGNWLHNEVWVSVNRFANRPDLL
jgi:hypothetical protein